MSQYWKRIYKEFRIKLLQTVQIKSISQLGYRPTLENLVFSQKLFFSQLKKKRLRCPQAFAACLVWLLTPHSTFWICLFFIPEPDRGTKSSLYLKLGSWHLFHSFWTSMLKFTVGPCLSPTHAACENLVIFIQIKRGTFVIKLLKNVQPIPFLTSIFLQAWYSPCIILMRKYT